MIVFLSYASPPCRRQTTSASASQNNIIDESNYQLLSSKIYTLNLNVLGAYLYARNSEIKQYAIQNTIVAIPKVNIGI